MKVARVPTDELLPVVAAFVVALLVEIGLRTVRLPLLARLLGAPLCLDEVAVMEVGAIRTPARFAMPARARRQLRASRRVLRHWPFGDTCLRQALVSGHQLRRFDPLLRLGVVKIDGTVRAHAWLEISGVVIDPRYAATSYYPLTTIPEGLIS